MQTPMKFQTISLKYFFAEKGAIYYVAIAMVIFSQVKITCYYVFARKRTWYLCNNTSYYIPDSMAYLILQ